MTIHTINNEFLTVTVSDRGAALQSICGADGTEYLWQRDPAYWEDSDLTIFPYVARLTRETYRYQGKEYHLPIHGIAPTETFEVVTGDDDLPDDRAKAGAASEHADGAGDAREDDRHPREHVGNTADAVKENPQLREHAPAEPGSSLHLRLSWSEESLARYPFRFVLTKTFRLEGSTLTVGARIENRDEKRMYFGYGGHPGFNVPLGEGERFEDYSLQFEQPCQPQHVIFTEDCFVTDQTRDYPLENDRILLLRHDLFDHDAIILRDMTRDVSLCDGAGRRRVRVQFPDQPLLGIWHMPRTDAPYVCIEPWSSLPARDGLIEDLEDQPDLLSLEPGAVYETAFTIRVY